MRKIILMLLAFMPAFCFAQDDVTSPAKAVANFFKNYEKTKPAIVRDEISSEGDRWVWGDYRIAKVRAKTGENCTRVELAGVHFAGDAMPTYYIYFRFGDTVPLRVEAQSPVLFKLADGTVLESKIKRTAEDEIGDVMVLMGHAVRHYAVYPKIEIDDTFVERISQGITKMRFEVNSNIYDVVLKKDNLSSFIVEEYKMIKETMSVKRDFREGF